MSSPLFSFHLSYDRQDELNSIRCPYLLRWPDKETNTDLGCGATVLTVTAWDNMSAAPDIKT